MKKLLLIHLALMVFLGSYAAHVAPLRTMVIPQATGAMHMDAAADETFYSAEQSTDAFNPTGSTGADADFTSSFKVCFDANYLYFFGKILDEYNNGYDSIGRANPWTYDNFELFMDLDTNGSGNNPAYDSNTVQIRFNRNADSVTEPGRAPRSAYIYSHDSELPDGWVVEIAIPWKFVLGIGQETEDIMDYFGIASGFDVSGADSDTDGADARDCQTAWDNDEPNDAADRTEDNAWNNRTVFGIITMGGEPCCDPCEWDPFACHGNSTNEIEYQELIIYPNPASNQLAFSNSHNYNKLEIFNVMGLSVLLSKELITGKNEIDISELPTGNMYLLRLTDQNGKIVNRKFVKE